MAIKLQAGELYFLGELDHRTQQPTPFVKIGIVREHDRRDTAKRLKEHQTGNPRQIFDVAVIATPFVEQVETTLHGLYAPRGVGGEWFELGGAELAASIDRAGRVADDMRSAEASVVAADRLVKLESSGDPVVPDSTMLDQHRRLLELKAIEKAIKAASGVVRSALGTAHRRGLAVERFVSVQLKQSPDAFDKVAFEQQHADLYAQYLRATERLLQRFTLAADKGLDVSLGRLAPAVAALSGDIEGAAKLAEERLEAAADLHALYLQLLVEEASANLEIEVVTAMLKTACGEAPGINGVCSWKRELKTETKLDETALKADQPELYSRFLVTKPPSTATVVTRNRGYAW